MLRRIKILECGVAVDMICALAWVILAVVVGMIVSSQPVNGQITPRITIIPPADDSATGEIRFHELLANGDHYVAFQAPEELDDSVTWVLPGEDGSAGEALVTDGDGNLSFGGGSGALPVPDTTTIVEGSSDDTKRLRFEVDGFTTGNTRVATWPDWNGTAMTLEGAQTITGDKTFDGIIYFPDANAEKIRFAGNSGYYFKAEVDDAYYTFGTVGTYGRLKLVVPHTTNYIGFGYHSSGIYYDAMVMQGSTVYFPGYLDGNGGVFFKDHVMPQADNTYDIGSGYTTAWRNGYFDGTLYMGGFNMATGASSGKVLTTDASGNGTWQTVSVGSADLIPDTDNTYDIGSSSYRWEGFVYFRTARLP